MYGLVNTAVADLARQVGGEQTWQEIRSRAGVEEIAFIGLNAYPDDLTYRLVDAASEVLGLTPEQVLAAFGRHWVRYTARQGWGPLLESAGDNLPAVLEALDALHVRVRLMMPQLCPPSFRVSDRTENGLRLHYYSERPGLAPMVIGLVEGLGEMLGTVAEVEHVVASAGGADHDEFQVRYGAAVNA